MNFGFIVFDFVDNFSFVRTPPVTSIKYYFQKLLGRFPRKKMFCCLKICFVGPKMAACLFTSVPLRLTNVWG